MWSALRQDTGGNSSAMPDVDRALPVYAERPPEVWGMLARDGSLRCPGKIHESMFFTAKALVALALFKHQES